MLIPIRQYRLLCLRGNSSGDVQTFSDEKNFLQLQVENSQGEFSVSFDFGITLYQVLKLNHVGNVAL